MVGELEAQAASPATVAPGPLSIRERSERGADLASSRGIEHRDALRKQAPVDRLEVVERRGALGWLSVFASATDLGRDAANGPGEGRDDDASEDRDRVAAE